MKKINFIGFFIFFLIVGTSLAFEPSLILNAPNSVYANQRFDLVVSANDPDGLNYISIDLGNGYVNYNCNNKVSCSKTWSVTENRFGSKVYYAKAVDKKDFTSFTSKTVFVNPEDLEPSANIIITPNPARVNQDIQVTVNGNDDVGLQYISVDTGNGFVNYNCNNQLSCSHTWVTKELSYGSRVYYAKAVDTFGHIVVISGNLFVNPEDLEPSANIIITPNPARVNQDIQVIVNGNDDVGLKYISVDTGDGFVNYNCNNQLSCSHTWVTKELSYGSRVYYGRAVDTFGHIVVISGDLFVNPEDLEPSASIIITPNPARVNQDIQVTVNGNDDVGLKYISVDTGDGFVNYNCNNQLSCSHTWVTKENSV